MESEIKIIDYDKQTSGTVYVVNFGDGRDTTFNTGRDDRKQWDRWNILFRPIIAR